jgi:hypothetical protein
MVLLYECAFRLRLMSASLSSCAQCAENTVGTSLTAEHSRKWNILSITTSVILRKRGLHKYCTKYNVCTVLFLFYKISCCKDRAF